MIAKHKDYITTGGAAKLCSVTPDTVLKWIKTGKIHATRTPGGHFRIQWSDLPSNLLKDGIQTKAETKERPFQYCWEFHTIFKQKSEKCRDCIVYRSRTKRCYEMVQLPKEVGHAMQFCTTSCGECDYYKLVKGQQNNVLVISEQPKLHTDLKTDAPNLRVNFNLAFTESEYHCSMLLNEFRPDFVVIDCEIGEERCQKLLKHLKEDPRLPVVRIILLCKEQAIPQCCHKDVFALIKPTVTAKKLNDLIEKLSR